MSHITLDSESALVKLRAGNDRYVKSGLFDGDVGPGIRLKTVGFGQNPYAVVIACSDSRVIPEAVFSAGIGDLFVIRSAGNTAGEETLGSIEYAISHLGVRLVVLMGHLCCGAVNAAMEGNHSGWTGKITENIADNIRCATDAEEACEHNVRAELEYIRLHCNHPETLFIGAVYDTLTGKVLFLEE